MEFRKGERLYRAHTPRRAAEAGEQRTLYASREVILARRRVQLPAAADAVGHRPSGRAARATASSRSVPLPGVGANLQDRYEVSVVYRMDLSAWDIYDGATFCAGDAAFSEWQAAATGLYATNGAVLTRVHAIVAAR